MNSKACCRCSLSWARSRIRIRKITLCPSIGGGPSRSSLARCFFDNARKSLEINRKFAFCLEKLSNTQFHSAITFSLIWYSNEFKRVSFNQTFEDERTTSGSKLFASSDFNAARLSEIIRIHAPWWNLGVYIIMFPYVCACMFQTVCRSKSLLSCVVLATSTQP